MEYLYLSFLGIFAGILSGFFGVGGGGLIVPVLLLFGFDIKVAVGISVMQMVFSSIFGSYLNFKSKLLDFKDGFYIGIGGAIGGLFSGFILKVIPDIYIYLAFICSLLFTVYRFYKAPDATNAKTDVSPIILFIIGLSIGIIAMCIGIGGSGIVIAILVGFFAYDMKKTISLGLFYTIFTSGAGFVSQSYNGLVKYDYGFTIGIFALIGVFLGLKIASKTDSKKHKKWLLGMYIFMILSMLLKLLEKF